MKSIRHNAKTLQVTTLAIGCMALVVLLPQWRNELQAEGYNVCPGDAIVSLNQPSTHEVNRMTCASFTAFTACSGELSALTNACDNYCNGPTGSGMCVGQSLTGEHLVPYTCKDSTSSLSASLGIPPVVVEVGESYPVATITCPSDISTDCHCLPESDVTITADPPAGRRGAASKRK